MSAFDVNELKHLKQVKYWGAATAAHQVEGNTHNQWSEWEKANAERLAREAPKAYSKLDNWPDIKAAATSPDNYISGSADDHYNRFEEDLNLLTKLNMNAYRFTIEWSRVEPEEGKWDERAIEHYREVIKALKERGIEPLPGLWHWTMPTWFTDKGGFTKFRNVKYFTRYADKIVSELGHELTFIMTLNEPMNYAGFSYKEGRWPPQKESTIQSNYVVLVLAHAHRRAYRYIKRQQPKLQVGMAKALVYNYRGNNSPGARFMTWFNNFFENRWFLMLTKGRHDFLGVNHYFTNRVSGLKDFLAGDEPDAPRNDLGWPMTPANIEQVITRASKRYKKPIFVLENGLADARDQHRQWWLEETLLALERAADQGVELIGYLHWSLLDNFEWAEGHWPRFGLVEIDREDNLKRTIRPSAKWFARVIKELRS